MKNLNNLELKQFNGGKAIRIEDWYNPNCGREEYCNQNPKGKLKRVTEYADPFYFSNYI